MYNTHEMSKVLFAFDALIVDRLRLLLLQRRRAVKDELGNLSSLDARPVGALGRALELERDVADVHFAQTLLAKVAELRSVEDGRRRVERVRLHLNRLLKVDVERVARSVREEFGVVLGQHTSEPFQFDADAVVGRAVGRAVEAEADDEDALVHAELDAVAPAPVAPLVAPVGRRLEPVANLRLQSGTRLAAVQQRRLVSRRVVQEHVRRLLQRQDPRLGSFVGEILQSHCGQPDQKQGIAHDGPAIVRVHLDVAPFALGGCPLQGGLENDRLFEEKKRQIKSLKKKGKIPFSWFKYLFAVERFALQNLFERVHVDFGESFRVEGQLCLGVNHFPAARHEFGLLKESRLAEEETGVAGRQTRFQKEDASAAQVRHNVLFGHVECRQDRVGFQRDLVAVQVPTFITFSHFFGWRKIKKNCLLQKCEKCCRFHVRHFNLGIALG